MGRCKVIRKLLGKYINLFDLNANMLFQQKYKTILNFNNSIFQPQPKFVIDHFIINILIQNYNKKSKHNLTIAKSTFISQEIAILPIKKKKFLCQVAEKLKFRLKKKGKNFKWVQLIYQHINLKEHIKILLYLILLLNKKMSHQIKLNCRKINI